MAGGELQVIRKAALAPDRAAAIRCQPGSVAARNGGGDFVNQVVLTGFADEMTSTFAPLGFHSQFPYRPTSYQL